jgi:type VI secretion system protein ImpD
VLDQGVEQAVSAGRPTIAEGAPPGVNGWGAQPLGAIANEREIARLRIDRIIAGLDALVTEQVNAVIHHARFRQLEASWRSLARLVGTAERSSRTAIKIRVLDLRWNELCRDLERAIEFDQSELFRKIYEEEFGTAGGQPFGLLVGDYFVAHRLGPERSTDDIAALHGMARIAAAAFAPFVVGAAPAFFGVDAISELAVFGDPLTTLFRTPEYRRWRSFQEHEDARFVGLVLPRVAARAAYRDDDARNDGFRFREHLASHDEVAWGSATYAFAAVVMRAFAESGWFAAIRGGKLGEENGGLVPDLEIPWFATDAAGVATIFPGETQIEDGREVELDELGFIPMVRAGGTSLGMFCGNASAQQPRVYDRLAATVNARLSSMLQYMLCVGRFAHYVKVIARDKIGSFASAAAIQQVLQDWLMQYCNTNERASAEILAQQPLRHGRIEVRDVPGKPGAFFVIAHLQPHFQLERVETTLRLTTELATARSAEQSR